MKTADLFSPSWAAAVQRAVNDDAAYASAGARWQGGVALRRTDGDGAGVVLHLDGGQCHGADIFEGLAPEGTRVAIAAPSETWDRVLAGEVDPILGLARGSLALERGSMVTLLPHAAGAKALIAAIRRLHDAGGSPPSVAAPATEAPRARSGYQTLDSGLAGESVPMRLYHKAKRLGIWDPRDLDLTQDREDWLALANDERDLLLRLASLFQAGEEAVTLDLLPLMHVIASEGRLEEEMYLTTFLFEEAKHVETFQRFFDEVAPGAHDLAGYRGPAHRRIFDEELPSALGALAHDRSPEAQARASVTYNMIVEGVLAETGYRGYHAILESRGILPGMQHAVRLLKRDESRHIAYGLHLLSRLVADHGTPVWSAVEARMSELLDPALAVVDELFAAYDAMPFGLVREDFTAYALEQFQARLRKLDEAHRRRAGLALDELEQLVGD